MAVGCQDAVDVTGRLGTTGRMRRVLSVVAFAVAGALGGLLALALMPAPRADVGPG